MIGSNTSAQHPLAYARITAAKKRGAKLITVDPRRTPVATLSDIHLAIRPGSNLALVNALMHVILFEEKGQDDAFINERTEHFDALRASLEGCSPEWAAPLTGLQPEAIRETARLYAKGPNSIILYCMGVTQQVTGTRTCGALANLVMLCGMIGRPSTGLIPLRGQNNVQGSCDMGALPETLPGYVKADSELGHQRFARLWGPFADEQGKKLTEIMDGMRDGSIRAAYIMGENPMQSDPDAAKVEAGLRNLDFLIVQDIFMTPTARLADVILPAKNIDGVYNADPAKDANAIKYDAISYEDVLAQHLAVMDSTATSLSMDNHIPVLVFALKDPENIIRAVEGEKIGTIVGEN